VAAPALQIGYIGLGYHERVPSDARLARIRSMLFRAIVAFIAFPGLAAYAIPVAIGVHTHRPAQHLALTAILVLAGTAGLLWCVREFYVAGRETLAPWQRPKHLVTSGPYRFSRNPMYVCCAVILLGWCVLWDSPGLRICVVVTLVVLFVRVRFLEEVWVTRHFGADCNDYRLRTPRWQLPLRNGRGAANTPLGRPTS
jgi:protein-S-isoprenylcysteine O-methyltransferase Ste14